MIKPTLTITISGLPGAGKSTIAELVRTVLEQHSINVEFLDDNGTGFVDEAPGVIAMSLPMRLNSLREKKSRIKVKTLMSGKM